MQKLVLFDIDGTLLNPDGAGRRAMTLAFEEVYGTAGSVESYSMAGKTDLQITVELMTAAGLSEGEVRARLDLFWRRYAEILRAVIPEHRISVLPGVVEVVNALKRREGVLLGLLTGNVEEAAWLKLRTVGLDPYFSFGAFGGVTSVRDDLSLVAVEAAQRLTGRRFQGQDVVIIGDTPLDIACGRSIGAWSIAVGTGTYSVEELLRHGPDYCFIDLRQTAEVVNAVLGK